ncbi:MAG TPA: hypothetical protein VGN76_12305 [Gemmatimonadales bacterium]|jgi:hypothetical protein|nr:hypothetical protein [Gemmatimonadales bacterium]
MGEPNFANLIATLNSTLQNVEARLAGNHEPVEGLEDFKSALDDMRLRLWGLLSAAGADDFKGFQERFRIRRATEMCHGLSGDLGTGSLGRRHAELTGLREAALELSRSVERAQQH